MVGFSNFTPDGRGIDPDIFFDDDGKVWYVGTAAPAKPNFPGEGGESHVPWEKKVGVKRCSWKSSFKTNQQQKWFSQKKAGNNNSRYLEFLPSLFFCLDPFFFVGSVFLGHQTWEMTTQQSLCQGEIYCHVGGPRAGDYAGLIFCLSSNLCYTGKIKAN